VTQTEIRACFDEGWHVDSIEPAILEVIFGMGVQAWLAAITRT